MKNHASCDLATLAESLTEALAMADALDLPLVAIHIDQAIAQLAPPIDLVATVVESGAPRMRIAVQR